jgi:hypothetical protein
MSSHKAAGKPCHDKCNPVLPDKKAKAASNQGMENPCPSVANESTKCNVRDMGMFYFHKPDMKATDVFPKDMPEKVCINFICQGRLCTKKNCSFTHPRNATELQKGALDFKDQMVERVSLLHESQQPQH